MKSLKSSLRIKLLRTLTEGHAHNWLRAWGYEIAPYPQDKDSISAHLASLLPTLDINCVLDVGANRGQYAAMLRMIGYRGKIISFEPVRENYQALADRFRNDADWTGYPIALGEENSNREINVTEYSVFSSFLQPSDYSLQRFGGDSSVIAREQVMVKRLDDVLPKAIAGMEQPRIFLKMDTQGFDLQVLRGATDSIHTIIGLQTELSMIPVYQDMPSHVEALTRLADLGFQITGMFPLNQDEALRATEFDCVCVRRDFRPGILN